MALKAAHSRSPQPITPLIHSAHDTGIMLNCSNWTVRKLYRDGKLKGLRMNGRLMFRTSEIERFLKTTETTYEPNDNSVGARFQHLAIAARRKVEARKAARKITSRKGGRRRAA